MIVQRTDETTSIGHYVSREPMETAIYLGFIGAHTACINLVKDV